MIDYKFRAIEATARLAAREKLMFVPDGSYIGTVTDIREKTNKEGYRYFQIRWDLQVISHGEDATGWEIKNNQYINDFISPDNPAAKDLSLERLSKMVRTLLEPSAEDREVSIEEFLHKEARLVIKNKQDKFSEKFWPRIMDITRKPTYLINNFDKLYEDSLPASRSFDEGDEIPF